ncbi:unnamed protein product [Rotaria sordida]|uniref:Uncharacterized protein n=1 Tax=Rotaria sordida TaxID=392033 RepID=A0A813WF15_9BILA|nr:unnamed protein product [Rotaria sordida]
MTVMNTSLLVLLDLQDEHKNFETIFDSHIFCRFTNKIQCLEHVSSRLTNIRLLHFFIPKSEHIIIDARLLFFNTIYYIYCIDQISINEMKQQYDYPMFVKIFHIKSLSTYLYQAAIAHLIEQAERRKHEPDEHDIALQAAAEFSDILANELYEYMIEKIG